MGKTRIRVVSLFLLTAACGPEAAPPAVSASAAAAPFSPPPPPPNVAPPAPPTPPPTPAAPRAAFATVNGLKMHYLRLGDRPGESRPVLVLLHAGGGSASACWPVALPFFAEHFDVIAPDQLAQGGTPDDPKHPMTPHAMAEDTVALLAQLGVTHAAFVGWSDGGNLALDIGMHHPELVTRIVASSANFEPGGVDPGFAKMLHGMKADSPMIVEGRDAYAKESPDGVAHWPVVFGRLRKMWETEPHWTAKQLGTIKAPTLIIGADHDLVRVPHTVALAAAIPGSELLILPHADHEVPLGDAPRWDAAVLAFLEAPPPKPTQ